MLHLFACALVGGHGPFAAAPGPFLLTLRTDSGTTPHLCPRSIGDVPRRVQSARKNRLQSAHQKAVRTRRNHRRDRVQKLSGDFDAAMKATEKRSLDKKGSVLRALWACHKPAMIKTAWVKVLHDILQFTFPVLLRWMLRHLQDGGSRGVGELRWRTSPGRRSEGHR